jgi:hypothetical protein
MAGSNNDPGEHVQDLRRADCHSTLWTTRFMSLSAQAVYMSWGNEWGAREALTLRRSSLVMMSRSRTGSTLSST